MAKPRGELLTALPATLHPEQRLTAVQAMALTGRARTQFYQALKAGELPAPAEKAGRFVRWRAGDLLAALQGGGRA